MSSDDTPVPTTLHAYLGYRDAQATDATVVWAPQGTDWGNYRCRLVDPQGIEWTVGTHRPGEPMG